MLKQRWSFALWFPFFAASCAAAAYLFLAVDDGVPGARGPGGGGEGILFLVVSFLRLLAVMAIVACLVLLPRGAAWNGRAVVVSTLAWGAIFAAAALAYGRSTGMTVCVRAVDTTGRPLAGVRMEYKRGKWYPLMRRAEDLGTAVTDASGTATFHVPAFDTLDVYGDKMLRPTHDLSIHSQHEGATLLILHSIKGTPDRKPYSVNARSTTELTASMEFDPPPGR